MKNTLKFPAAEWSTCPRCGGRLPVYPKHEGPGVALSRLTREPGVKPVYICSTCGVAEAMEQFALGRPLPMSAWYGGLP